MNSEYPLYDGIGSERTVTAANQSVQGTITFEGFGQTIATTGSSANPYMFKGAWGYRNDGDAGLSHVGARYYDAQVGRFITRDSELDEHPYRYCEHDPVNFADPKGHSAEGVMKLGGTIFGIPHPGAKLVGGAIFIIALIIVKNEAEDKLIRGILKDLKIPNTPEIRGKLHDRIEEEKQGGPRGRGSDLSPQRIKEIAEDIVRKASGPFD